MITQRFGLWCVLAVLATFQLLGGFGGSGSDSVRSSAPAPIQASAPGR